MANLGFGRASLIYIGSAGISALIPFFALPFLTRWLGPAEYGIVGAMLAVNGLAVVFAGLCTNGFVSVVYFRDGPESLPVAVGASLRVLIFTTLGICAVLLVLSDWIVRGTGMTSGWIWTIGAAACGQFVVSVTLAVWQVQQLPWRYAAIQAGFSLLWSTISLLLVGWLGMGWEGRALGQAAAALLLAILCLAALTKAKLVDFSSSIPQLRPALRFGLPLVPHSLAAMLMTSVDRLAVGNKVGEFAAGEYFVAFQIASIITTGAAALNQAWVPWLYARLRRGDSGAHLEIVRTTYLLCGFLLLSGAVTALIAPWLLALFAGSAFPGAAKLLGILGPAAAFSGMYYFASGYLFYRERTELLSLVTLCTVALQVPLTLWYVGEDGAAGGAKATLLTAIFYWAATAWMANRVAPMPWLGTRTQRSGRR